eukprot:1139145-Pelagomonas_calceolata.AAC.5
MPGWKATDERAFKTLLQNKIVLKEQYVNNGMSNMNCRFGVQEMDPPKKDTNSVSNTHCP